MSQAKTLAKEQVEKTKRVNKYKWRNRFMFLFFSIFGFLLVSITSIFFPLTWAPLIKDIVKMWGVPAVVLYGVPALLFIFGAHATEPHNETLGAVSRVFFSLALAAGVMSIFSYILATGMVGAGGAWLWSDPFFIMTSGWLIFFDIVFGIFLSWELIPKQWAWLFFKFGYECYPPPAHEDRIFHRLRVFISYDFVSELKRIRSEGRGEPAPKRVPIPAPKEEPESAARLHEIPPDVLAALERADKIIAGEEP